MLATEQRYQGTSETDTGQTGLVWELVRDHALLLDAAAMRRGAGGINLMAGEQAEYIQQQRISAGFFHVLGTGPLLGREFTREEDVPKGPDVAVLSYRTWERLFHRSRNAIGQVVHLGGAPYAVVGVMPENFRTHVPTDVWTPLRATRSGEGAGTNFEIIGRLKPGVKLAEASGQLTAVVKQAFADSKLPPGFAVKELAIPLQEGLGSDLRSKLELMWAAAGVVLLIGCFNIAGLLLSRSVVRSREIATRLALGASRSRVVSQLLAEAARLALLGGLVGLAIGQLSLKALLALSPDRLGNWATARLDWDVMGVMLLCSLATTFIFGLMPALEATRVDLRSALADAGRSSSAGSKRRRRQLLVVAEVALSVVLVAAAGLLIRTFDKLATQDPGFNGEHVLAASLSLQDVRYADPVVANRLFRSSLDQIRLIPGVESAAVALSLPYQRPLNMNVQAVSGEDVAQMDAITNMTYATPEFFEVLRIPLIRGRFLTASDTASSAKAAVVNKAFLRKYFRHNQQPLGSQVKVGDVAFQVVGLVGDVPELNGWGGYMGPLDELRSSLHELP